jgi:hypothetical protein
MQLIAKGSMTLPKHPADLLKATMGDKLSSHLFFIVHAMRQFCGHLELLPIKLS